MNLVSTSGLTLVVLLALLAHPASFIQSATQTAQPQRFNIHGRVSIYPNDAISDAKVIFKGQGFSRTVYSDENGIYEANLPVGLYTMFVVPLTPRGLRTYQRPLFRIAPSTNIIWNVSLWPGANCTFVDVPQGSEHIPTEGEITGTCGGWDFFPLSSQDGIPFQLLIDYPARQHVNRGSGYISWSSQNIRPPVFVAYNLFTLEADRVTYDEKTRTLEAKGNVVEFNEKGEKQSAESMTFRIGNGEATRLH